MFPSREVTEGRFDSTQLGIHYIFQLDVMDFWSLVCEFDEMVIKIATIAPTDSVYTFMDRDKCTLILGVIISFDLLRYVLRDLLKT